LFETSIGGGGRFIDFGGVTLRMFLFILALTYFFINFIFLKVKVEKKIIVLSLYFSFILFTGIIIALFTNTNYAMILEDIKPLSFFYIILFYSFNINELRDLKIVHNIFKSSAIILAIAYGILLVLLFTNTINAEEFYMKQNDLGEISFRDGFFLFYKGFIFLCIGYIFFLTTNNKFKFPFLLFLFISIFLSFTRGFLLFTIIITIIYFIIKKKNIIEKILLFFTTLLFIFLVFTINIYEYIFGDKTTSDTIRIDTINEVIKNTNIISFFVGHGFGNGVPTKPVHMEISFLEIFYKQGLIGVLFWIFLFVNIFYFYNKIIDFKLKKLAYPFLLGTIFIFLQSFTNPYMNNPIGLSFILISYVVIIKINNRNNFI
jgi:hypothetical protein